MLFLEKGAVVITVFLLTSFNGSGVECTTVWCNIILLLTEQRAFEVAIRPHKFILVEIYCYPFLFSDELPRL